MILVTTGTSLPHDKLLVEIDRLIEEGFITEKVYAQIGNGNYIPKNVTQWKRFVHMEEAYKRADLVISNCGAGTLLENAIEGRKLIAVQNPDITGGHEWELVSELEQGDHLIWCRDVKDLANCIELAKRKEFKKFVPLAFNVSLILELMFE